jgi:hypothetical protein
VFRLEDWSPTGDCDAGAGDEAGFVRGKHDVHRSQLGGLADPSERGIRTFSGGSVDGISGVHTGPGATLFTRIPRGPSICARLAHMLAIPALVIAYGINVGLGLSEFTDDDPMIDEPSGICGTAAFAK